MNCFVTQKTVVVGSIFLLSEFVVTTPDESKAWKQLFLYFHAPRILRPVEGGGAGGLGGSSPQKFWKLKNITINVPKNIELKRINVQRIVLNADAKSSFYNFTTFSRVLHLLSY